MRHIRQLIKFKSHIAKCRSLAARIARHLQLIVIILFFLYALGCVAVIDTFPKIRTFGQFFGSLLALGLPLPILVAEVLAVFRRWESAAYLCAACWISIGAVSLFGTVMIAFKIPDWQAIVFTAFIFIPLGLMLAVVHLEWPKLAAPPERK